MNEILFSIDNRRAAITLNRPKSLNSLNAGMLSALNQAVKDVADSDARVLCIGAAGRGFCSGQDLSDPAIDAGGGDLGAMLERHYNPLMRALLALDIPVVSAVGGVAAGAGVGLALAADFMLMRESASLVLAFSRIGLVADAGSSWLLTRALGVRRAKALAMSGAKINSAQALEWGLASAVYDDDNFEGEVDALCARLAEAPTRGLGYSKRVFARAAVNDFEAQLEVEKEFQRRAGRTADYREGVEAFLAGRKPQFSGE